LTLYFVGVEQNVMIMDIFGIFKILIDMVKLEKLLQFVRDETWTDVFEDSDIERDLGCTGDDFSELMEKYALRYSVNMDSYLWCIFIMLKKERI